MLLEYKATNGQSVLDICLNTYGTSDLIYKLIQDSAVANIDYIPKTGDIFYYDPSLTINQNITRTKVISQVRYATLANVDLSSLPAAFRKNYN